MEILRRRILAGIKEALEKRNKKIDESSENRPDAG